MEPIQPYPHVSPILENTLLTTSLWWLAPPLKEQLVVWTQQFSADGLVTTLVEQDNDEANALLPDSEILLAGRTDVKTRSDG